MNIEGGKDRRGTLPAVPLRKVRAAANNTAAATTDAKNGKKHSATVEKNIAEKTKGNSSPQNSNYDYVGYEGPPIPQYDPRSKELLDDAYNLTSDETKKSTDAHGPGDTDSPAKNGAFFKSTGCNGQRKLTQEEATKRWVSQNSSVVDTDSHLPRNQRSLLHLAANVKPFSPNLVKTVKRRKRRVSRLGE